MGFKCKQPLGLPQAHPLHSHQIFRPDTPHLSLHRVCLGVKQSLLKANGILLGLCFITQTQCCFTRMVVAHYSSLPVQECQVPHIWVFADDRLTLSLLRESSRNVSLHIGMRTHSCHDFSSGSDTSSGIKRAHQFPQGQLKERQPEEKGFLHTHFHTLYVASLMIFLFTRSPWRPVKRLHLALPSCSDKYAIIPQQVYQNPC